MERTVHATLDEIFRRPPPGDPYLSDLSNPAKGRTPYALRAGRRIPYFWVSLVPGLIGALISAVIWESAKLLELSINAGWLVTFSIFPFVIALNGLQSDARAEKQRAVGAFDLLRSGNSSTIAMIKTVGDYKQAIAFHIELLRCLYCETMGREIRVNDETGLATSAFERYVKELHNIGLAGALVGGQGRVNALLQGAATLRSVRETGIGRSVFISTVILFLISYAMLILGMAAMTGDKQIPMHLGAVIAGTFTYAVTLLLLGANDAASPFGTGKSSLSRAALFKELEEQAP